MRTTTKMRLMAALALLAGLGGCAGSDAVLPTTAAPSATTTTMSTPTAPPPMAVGTTSSPGGAATTADTAWRDVRRATVDGEGAVRLGLQHYFLAYGACGEAPATCDPSSFLAPGGPALAKAREFVAGLVTAGFSFGADVRGSYIVAESVSFLSDDEAEAIACWFDAGVVLGPDGPDGQPTVVNDRASSSRYRYELRRAASGWLVVRETALADLGEGNRCPPAF